MMPPSDWSRGHESHDRSGELLGTIRTPTEGKVEAKNAGAGRKATFDPETNETRDPRGNRVGTGNLLSWLLTT